MSRAGRWLPVALLLAVPAVVRPAPPEDATRPEPRQVGGNKGGVAGVDISPDGKLVASAGGDQTLRVWDVATAKEVRSMPASQGFTCCVRFSPDGKYVAAGGYGANAGGVFVYEVATGKELPRPAGHGTAGARRLAFAADSKLLVSGGFDGNVVIWDVATGKQVRRCAGNHGCVYALHLSPDGKMIVAGASDGALHLFDFATGKEVRKIQDQPQGAVYAAAFSPDGRTVASGDSSTARLWEVATGREIWRVSGIKAEFSSMAFSPDGRILYGGSYDSTVHVYEVATGREVRKLRGHREWVWNLNLTPDGRLLASGSKDGRALVWNVVEAARPAKRLKLTPADLEARWADLAAEDPGRGFPAVAALSAAPGQSVPFLRQRLTALLKPAPGLSPERIAQLIRDLDSDEFAVRKKASQELEKAGKQAEA
ncbi:MAG TPA: WD40 repeat domain-containing protein, partial [Gemmataceae bacterium]|nr:WD40 repeat domain-containing protein [Gemmataceae bacterium]